MTTKPEQVSSITNSSGVISKFSTDAIVSQSCSGDRSFYRIVRPAVSAGSQVFTSLIPLKAPCAYSIQFNWQGISSTGNVYSLFYVLLVRLPTSGGSTTSLITALASSMSVVGNIVNFTKNSSADALNVTLDNTVSGGIISDTFEVMVIANKNF